MGILSLRDTKGGASPSIVRGKTVPGKITQLVPPSVPKPNVSAASQTPSQAPAPYVPRFGRPKILVPDDFWSNLKQFLTERPIRVRERKGAPFTQTAFGAGFFDNLAESFRSTPGGNRPVNSRLAVSWGANFRGVRAPHYAI